MTSVVYSCVIETNELDFGANGSLCESSIHNMHSYEPCDCGLD